VAKIRAVIFDLDNVLYDEKDYFYAAFKEIAIFLSQRCNVSEEELFNRMKYDLQQKSSLYPRLFNDLIASLGLNQNLLSDLLALFFGVKVNLKMFPDSQELLLALKKQKIKLGLVTNGNVKTQKNKVKLLGIENLFDFIVFARELGADKEKPDPEAYRRLIGDLGVKAEETLCIGDNPYTDFWGAKTLGVKTVRLLRGEFKDVILGSEYETDFVVTTLSNVLDIIRAI
jgi:putative hydrolase of the HAD superfamily